ncbi:MAG: hypothetical protein LC130_25815 [Bryobacterales bacterium]|nr:hypothetical protein [Bryobacterales bacterium]
MAPTDKKTDNAFLDDKVKLRAGHLPADPCVLDCFAGNGIIWKRVQSALGIEIQRLAIEKEKHKGAFHLAGDNVRFLTALDLSRYNVIDLDAYGVPYEQIKILFERGYRGRVFFTFIQSVMGRMPNGLLIDIGFSKVILDKAPTLCGRRGWSYFLQYLAAHGVRQITYVQHQRKYYGYFDIGD